MKSEFLLTVIPMFLLASCGPAPGTVINTVNNPNNIDSTFVPLYSQFLQQASQNGLNLNYNQGITVQFANLEQKNSLGEIIGECSNCSIWWRYY